jgi:hypothetical protein
VSGRLGALGAAFTSEVATRSRRAFLLALAAGLLAAFALGASVVPIEISANLLIAYAAFLGAFALTLAAVLYQQFRGEFGDALAVAGWARLDADQRWRRLGAGRIPRSPAEAQRWLREHPDPLTLQPQRLSSSLLAGDLDGARAALGAYPLETPFQRFDAVSDRWFLEFLEGQLPPLDDVEAAASNLEDEADRRQAAVAIATLRAHTAVAQGADWVRPVASVRPVLADAAGGIIAARYIIPAWTASVAIAALLIGIALLFGRISGVWR